MEAEKTFEYIKGVCIDFTPTVVKRGSAISDGLVLSKEFLTQQLASGLPHPRLMAHLYLVKGNKKRPDAPRRGRGASASTERRYRYPSEEIWQVSEDKWQVAESRYLPEEEGQGFSTKA
jgi:hypothetical protein